MCATISPHPLRPNDPNWHILAGFRTGGHELQQLHREWLLTKVLSCLSSERGWVHLRGLASHLGTTDRNDRLARMRVNAVKSFLVRHGAPGLRITGVKSAGESMSGGGVNNNDPLWRGVEVIVTPTQAPPAGYERDEGATNVSDETARPTVEEPASARVKRTLAELFQQFMFQPANWRIVTSGGVEGTVSPSAAGPFQFGAAGNVLYLVESSGTEQARLGMLGAGPGLGHNFEEDLFWGAIDISFPCFPGGGIGEIHSHGGRELVAEDFNGFFVLCNLQGTVGFVGWSVAAVFMGLPIPTCNTLEQLALAKAVGVFWSQNMGLQAPAVGLQGCYGYARIL